MEFSNLNLKDWLVKQCHTLGLKQPTPIQKGCVPKIMAGQDCIGTAKTGSGKTFAFALPILNKFSDDPYGIFALILTPTHELAYQIAEQFTVLGQPLGVRVVVVAGGTDQLYESQRLSRNPHIVVAMPGRLSDHINGCDTFTLRNIQFLVLDEADRLLSGNFDENLTTIANVLPEKKQTLLFSATLDNQLAKSEIIKLNDNAFSWSSEDNVATVDTLDQRYLLCASFDRDVMLVQTIKEFMEKHEDGNIMVFTNTKKDCQLLSMTLSKVEMVNVCLHGFLKQRERLAALAQFKSKTVRILIATDVASRGLDIPTVQLVINHQLPQDPKEYIHRVGRTARAGRKGMAISIFRFPRDMEFLSQIESAINTKLTEYKIDDKAVERIFLQISVTKRQSEVTLENKDFDERTNNYRRKKWIEKGLDPDMMEEEFKKKCKKIKKERKAAYEALKKENAANRKEMVTSDDRFKNLPTKEKRNISYLKLKSKPLKNSKVETHRLKSSNSNKK